MSKPNLLGTSLCVRFIQVELTKNFYTGTLLKGCIIYDFGGHHGRDRMLVGFTATYAISAYHHWCCEFESR